ncbi:uncharacterized protein HMPREF1541_00829 [Cyphellophora europaea CBS 101466]|uniref:NADH dehydrogenase [ubiquinone] 1 alpha subcomplex subunit 1 n=1 Tax=Cyphellophora europaea (strain CBS 101466) TaxID=1220924 RepID=W2SF33_CYPE1|nr:uncharacterized protein HMPREF1541_00829 [Cyphellophora europaea CBS 101466]ETN46643.1 hypothetical protein HMPREF1541_00829 [Cyphellophora europaea CBS 101466]
MGVPFEALLPYGIMIGLFGVTGVGLSTIRYYNNNQKRPRWNLDMWERQMMERDQRITGVFRGQSEAVEAPAGFEVNSRWKAETQVL